MRDTDPQTPYAPLPFNAGHGWLAAVVPAEASRFRVFDADIAHTLEAAGAHLVARDPDVEIGEVDELSDEAPLVVSNLDASPAGDQARLLHVGRRIGASAAVRVRSKRARRELRRRGYRHVMLLPWDRDQVVRLPGLPGPIRLAPAERFPCRVIVVGSRRRLGETALERALFEAGELAGRRLYPSWPLARNGGLVALCDGAVLRVATGAGRQQIRAQANVLRALAAAGPAEAVAARVPQILGEGGVGATSWSLEARLAGKPAPHSLDRSLLEECVDFLVELHRLGANGDPDAFRAHSRIVEGVLPPDRRAALREIAQRAGDEVAQLPRVFCHGDFCTSNLLADRGRLAGVVDWEATSHFSLPVLDLLHLHLLATSRANVYQWGPAVVGHLLPLMQRGGDTVIRRYLKRVRLDLDRSTLEALVAAYWLERASYQLGTYIEPSRDRVWIERNVVRVLDGLIAARGANASTRTGSGGG